ncbi:MAG TPA: metallopeptidase TldD-related protein [Bryobacteraceae bacterium]|nr:metallopeptidase TldD-related protein [Bryobacteraceae bacterium]
MLLCAAARAAEPDVLLKAMKAEIERARELKFENLESPYYVEVNVDDVHGFSTSATLGGLISANRPHFRSPRVQVRVGSYKFDNTNYVGSGFTYGSNYDVDRLPLDDNLLLLRRYLWLAIDRAYKSAVEAIARKRAALKNVSLAEHIDDFAKAEPVKRVEPVSAASFDEERWKNLVRSLSAVFRKYPDLRSSLVEFSGIHDIRYMATSEGAEIRIQEHVALLRARVSSQASDGMMLRDAVVFQSSDAGAFASASEMERAVTALAENVSALAKAPRGENYNGPVVFEKEAAAQVFAQIIGKNLALTRRPVMEPGRPGAIATSELEGRFGARILPEWMDIVDDPTQTEWRGRRLFGHYRVDSEGVLARPLSLVEKGVLKNFLLTRQPMRGFTGSNGHGRLPGAFGADAAGIGNLFVKASETVAPAELKKKMIEICKTRNKPYGILIRKMDYPSSASYDELRRLLTGSASSGGSAKPVSIPILAYRVYADGREELVRGLRFRGFNARSLKDILAASDENYVFDFLDNGAPMALMGSGGSVAQSCVISPSVLIDDLEMERSEEDFPKVPVVPPPS